MEMLTDSRPECQICFHPYSTRRRPKLLACGHTCCTVCLTRMGGREVRCPFCRSVTPLPDGLRVSQLPDDRKAFPGPPVSPDIAPVFIRIPSGGCYLLPPLADTQRASVPHGHAGDFTVRDVSELNAAEEQTSAVGAVGAEQEDRDDASKHSEWSAVCVVLVVALVFVFILGIILHNMTCASKPFTVILCE